MERTYAEVLAAAEQSGVELVVTEHRGDHAIVRLADPDKLNVLSAPLTVQLRVALERLVTDHDVRSVVITGAGRAFSAGGDLRMMSEATERLRDPADVEGASLPWQWIRYQFGGIARLIARSDKAFVAALNGPAAGVGLAFALACDLTLAARGAVLVPAFGKLGLLPEVGTSWALTRALGYRRAFAYYVGGEHIDAERALELGLVNEVVPAEELLAAALDWCAKVAALPPHALAMAKPLLRSTAELSWEHALTMEEFAEPLCFTTEGFANGVRQVLAQTSGGGQ